jgi:hypothetical protein
MYISPEQRKINISNRIGKIYYTKNGNEKFTIIRYFNCNNVDIQFEDGTIVNRKYVNIKSGNVSNPYSNKPTVSGVGYIGIGKYTSYDKAYGIWTNILERCYQTYKKKDYQSYIGCTVVEEWKNYQNFAKWYESLYIDGYFIDKDLLTKNNKIYGPETCCLLPPQISNAIVRSKDYRGENPIGVYYSNQNKGYTGQIRKFGNTTLTLGTYPTKELAFEKYKQEKENYLNELAYIWKNKISEKVYQALIDYKVEITD